MNYREDAYWSMASRIFATKLNNSFLKFVKKQRRYDSLNLIGRFKILVDYFAEIVQKNRQQPFLPPFPVNPHMSRKLIKEYL